MGELSTKCVCVADLGLFVELAPVLARSFGRTLYYVPGQATQFPRSNIDAIGRGIPHVERVTEWTDVIDDVDLWVFPDVWMGAVQCYLADVLGKRVWGSRRMELCEHMRLAAKQRFADLDIPVGRYDVVTGTKALREYIADHDDVWVKLAGVEGGGQRGDCETWHADNAFLAEQRIRELEYKMGDRAETLALLCEEPIPDAVEIAYDGYSVDGQYPRYAAWGVEEKSAAYVGRFSKYDKLPSQLRDFNEKFAGDLKATQCRSWFGAEMRVQKDGAYTVLDPLARCGSPPGELTFEWYTNLAEIMWEGAGGKCIDPKPKAIYGAELLCHSDWANDNHQPVEFPDKYTPNVKFRNLTVRKAGRFVVPQQVPVSQVCAVIGWGKTPGDACEMVKEVAGSVKAYGLDTGTAKLDDALKTWDSLPSYGVLS